MDEEKIKKMQEEYKEKKSQMEYNNYIEDDIIRFTGLNAKIKEANDEESKMSAAKIKEKQQNVAKSIFFYVVFCKMILKNIIPFIKDMTPEHYELFIMFAFKIFCLFSFINIIKSIIDYIKTVKNELDKYEKKQNSANILNTQKSTFEPENEQIGNDYIEEKISNKIKQESNNDIFNVEKKYCKKCGNVLQIYTINGKKVEQCINPNCKRHKF